MKRRGLTLIEILVASALMVLVGALIMVLLSGGERFRHHSHEQIVASAAVQSVIEHYADYPFEALDSLLGGHHGGGGIEDFLIALPDDLAEQTGETLEPRARVRFQRLVPFNELGLLRAGVAWRSPDGRSGQHSFPRLVIDQRLYDPIELPSSAEELERLADEDRERQERWLSGPDIGEAERARRRQMRSYEQGADLGFGAWHTHPDQGSVLRETEFTRGLDETARDVRRRQQAGETFDQLMEMLHAQYHAGEDEVHGRSVISSIRQFAGSAGQGYDWDRALDQRLAPGYAMDRMMDLVSERPIPDGDYHYDALIEHDPLEAGSQGRVFICYALRDKRSANEYVLIKEVLTSGDGSSTVRMEGRVVVDCGDREVIAEGVSGVLGHLEATTRRAYFYRPAIDEDGFTEPFLQVLSIRSFPADLVADEHGVPVQAALDSNLPPILESVGAGDTPLDGRKQGIDTKRRLSW